MKVGIIGAGASGMMAAVTAADYGAEVTVFEKNDRVGKKLLVTGNGKCNLGNLTFDTGQYYCDDAEKLGSFFDKFSTWDTVSFFESGGMLVRNRNGYLYPCSEQASTVLDIFRKLLRERNVSLITQAAVEDPLYDGKRGQFLVKAHNESFWFDSLILSVGGPASQKKGGGHSGFAMAERFGHKIHALAPGLVQLRSKEAFLKGMAGVRARGDAALYIDEKEVSREAGEVQFTETGISGIPVFQFSRTAAYGLMEGKKVAVKINFFPDYEKKAFEYLFRQRFEAMRENTLEDFLLGIANKKVNFALIRKEGFRPGDRVAELGFSGIQRLMWDYQGLTIPVSGTNGMESAQVCAGGVDFSEVDMELQSRKQPGLYLTGELLDVDGKCGGYNLQWAWTSGYIAGRSAARKGSGGERDAED